MLCCDCAEQTIGWIGFRRGGGPAAGATIIVQGTSSGTTTNANGRYSLSVPANAVIQVSYLGYVTQTIPVNGRTEINIQLEVDNQSIETVVVTGMTKIDKRHFTGAADRLSAEDVKISGMPDISRGLEGRSAGVSVQNVSGTFGSAPKIRVRGATSIYGSSKPLWVVDGVVMDDIVDISADDLSSGDAATLISSAIAGLNSEDIESFSILKDGSATSIYGARAMAGVIVITTKRGQAGVSRINYSGEFTFRLKPSYKMFNIMNSQDQMSVYQEMQQKGWMTLAGMSTAREGGVYGKMYEMINNSELLNTEAARNAYLRQAEYRNTDWFDMLFSNSMMHTHSVSMTSGTEKSSYYASLSAMIDPGWSKASKVNRYTANLNATYNIYPKLTLTLNTNGSYRKQRAPGTLSRDTDVVSGEVKRDFDINPYSYAMNTSRTLDAGTFYTRNYAPFNILHELDNNYMDLNIIETKFQAQLAWKPVKGLELTALGSIRYSMSSQEHNITDFSNQAVAYRTMPTTVIRDENPFLYKDPDDPYSVPVSVLPNGGIYERTDRSMTAYDFRASASYNLQFHEHHLINLYAGMEINAIDRRATWFRGWGLQYSMGEIPAYAYQVFKKGQEENSNYYTMNNTRWRNAAFFFNGTYSFKNKYIINGTLRYEGNNALGKTRSSRWLPTWNISGAWNAHEEHFFESLKPALSHLTLKASYSLTADAPSVTNSSMIIQSYIPWRPSTGSSESGLEIRDPANNALTYEKKHELNIGLDIGFLDDRINLAGDWYKRNNYDLIGIVATDGTSGFIDQFGNVASMKSNGWELTLSTQNIVTPNFRWTTDFTYSHSYNEVTSLMNNKRVIDMITGGFAREGYSRDAIFSIPFKGLNEVGIPTFLDQDGNITSTGIYFQERDKVDFLEYSGTTIPTDVGGFNNTFRYKGISLGVFMTYSFGNVVRLDPVFSSKYSDLDATPKEFKNRWAVAGDERLTDVPVIISKRQSEADSKLKYAYNAYNYSTARIAKGDFIRMKEISLTYDFPKSVISKLKFSSLSIKFQATNLFLIYADKKLNGQDPEFFNTGGVAAPMPRQFTFTLKIGL